MLTQMRHARALRSGWLLKSYYILRMKVRFSIGVFRAPFHESKTEFYE